MLIVVQSAAIILYVLELTLETVDLIPYLITVNLIDFACQSIIAYICLTMGSHQALKDFRCTIE